MTEELISTLYRRPCPSCARQYARDSRACPFCGYTEGAGSEAEEDQERLYGEYLMARYKQSRDEAERLRRDALLHPEDRNRERSAALAEIETQALERDVALYQEGSPQTAIGTVVNTAPVPDLGHVVVETIPKTRIPEAVREQLARKGSGGVGSRQTNQEPPHRAAGDKSCPACTATVPKEVERCACGYAFGAEVSLLQACPHCTAPVESGALRCGCGYPLTVGARVAGIPGIGRR